jgi:hypothetical protein
MFGMKLDKAKQGFFDRTAVTKAMDIGTRKALSKAGAFIRTRAKGAIKKRKKISYPGNRPSSHTGLLKKNIFFAYDHGTQSVVVGPTRLNQKDGTAPGLLEFGGSRTITKYGKKKVAVYLARPYMAPALELELRTLPSHWQNAVKGA